MLIYGIVVIQVTIQGKILGGRKIGMRLLCRNNFGNNRLQKELRIIPE